MKKKNVIAVLFMVLMIVIAIPTGMLHSIDDLRSEHEGSHNAVSQGLNTRADTAQNLVTIAEKYVDQDLNLETCIDWVDYYTQESINQDTEHFTKEVKEANTRLTDAVQELYDELKKVELSEKDQDYPDQLLALMKSEQDKIERSSYNDDAREFNQLIRNFPLNLVSIFGIEDMVTFDEAE